MISPDGIEQRLKGVVLEQLRHPVAPKDLQHKTSLYGKGLGLTSLDVVALIVRLEDEFEVYFEAEEIGPSVKTFGTLLSMVTQKVRGGGGVEPGKDHRS